MEKTILIDGKEVRMRASALIPRLYRFKFGRDMVSDMRQLEKQYRKIKNLPEDASEEEKQDAQLSVTDLTIFENVAYLFVKHADPQNTPDTPEEWLDNFDGVFDIYQVLPAILEMWAYNMEQTSSLKKN